jgi:hypothetical protein
MDAVVAFIANGEATKPVEPGERALDDPAEHAKAAAVGRAATAEDRNNAAGGEAITMWLRIVATVAPGDRLGSIQFFSPAHRADRPAVHHRPALVEPSRRRSSALRIQERQGRARHTTLITTYCSEFSRRANPLRRRRSSSAFTSGRFQTATPEHRRGPIP